MPIQKTLEEVRDHLQAQHVRLPSADDLGSELRESSPTPAVSSVHSNGESDGGGEYPTECNRRGRYDPLLQWFS